MPVGDLVKMCFSGKYTQKEVYKKICGNGGFNGYLHTNDAREVGKMAESGNALAKQVWEAFFYQIAKDAVAVLTIDRPKALNALNPEVLADLKAAFEAIDQNTVRCVVLTGAGDKSFVAGADIGSMSTMTKAEGEAFGKLGNDVFLMIESFPLPVIAAVNGFCGSSTIALALSGAMR